jgi:DNA-binding transcriptional regulator YbjK
VTHRAVTEKAGVPLATASYFFESIEELVQEALRVFTTQHIDRMSALAEQLAAERRTLDEVATAFAEASTPTLPETLAQFEAYLHAARTPELRDPVAETLAAYRRLAEAALRAAGAPGPEAGAAAFVALADGFSLHQLAAPGRTDPAAFPSAFRALFLGCLLDQGHTELAVRLAAER